MNKIELVDRTFNKVGLDAPKPAEKSEKKYSRPCSLPWCLFSAVQLILRAGLETTAFCFALFKGGDAGLVEFEVTLRETSRSLASDGEDPISTSGLVGRTAILLGCTGTAVGIALAVGNQFGAWVWGG